MGSQAWYDAYYAASKLRGTSEHVPPWYELILEAIDFDRDCFHADDDILELGCGNAGLLIALSAGRFRSTQLHGIEQSAVALEDARSRGLDVRLGNIVEKLPFEDSSMRGVILAEVIEHLESPDPTLREIVRVLNPGGRFYLTFPNYTNLPWLAKRSAAQLLNRPEWIVLQPTDHIYFYHRLKRRVEQAGLRFERSTGSVYLPPGLFRRESPRLRRRLTALHLSPLAFHPLLVFTKTE